MVPGALFSFVRSMKRMIRQLDRIFYERVKQQQSDNEAGICKCK